MQRLRIGTTSPCSSPEDNFATDTMIFEMRETRIERSGGEVREDEEDFTVQMVPPDRIGRGDWLAVNFLSPFLLEAYR